VTTADNEGEVLELVDLTVVGPVRAELWVRSSLDHTDLFVRLCDVDPKGRSWNRSDGIVGLRPQASRREADGTMRVGVELWPIANTFRRGHRLRLQVSSGAHPVYARNLGTGEPLGQATTMRAADIEVFRSPMRLSAVQLPVVAFPGRDLRPEGRA
jgi:putative CocE/NonD family hydrolase